MLQPETTEDYGHYLNWLWSILNIHSMLWMNVIYKVGKEQNNWLWQGYGLLFDITGSWKYWNAIYMKLHYRLTDQRNETTKNDKANCTYVEWDWWWHRQIWRHSEEREKLGTDRNICNSLIQHNCQPKDSGGQTSLWKNNQ